MNQKPPRSVRFHPELEKRWSELGLEDGSGAAVINLAVEMFFAHMDAGASLHWHVPDGSQKSKPILRTPDQVALEGKHLMDTLRELYGTQVVPPAEPMPKAKRRIKTA